MSHSLREDSVLPRMHLVHSENQSPRYILIARCGDSRIDPSTGLGWRTGDAFKASCSIANIIDLSSKELHASLEYALVHLNVREGVVAGHYGCGGIGALARGGISGVLEQG